MKKKKGTNVNESLNNISNIENKPEESANFD